MSKTQKIEVLSQAVSLFKHRDEDYISLTDMLKAKDGSTTDIGHSPRNSRLNWQTWL